MILSLYYIVARQGKERGGETPACGNLRFGESTRAERKKNTAVGLWFKAASRF